MKAVMDRAKQTQYQDIKLGETFCYDNEVCIKAGDAESSRYKAFELGGRQRAFHADTRVTRVTPQRVEDGTLVFEKAL